MVPSLPGTTFLATANPAPGARSRDGQHSTQTHAGSVLVGIQSSQPLCPLPA